ncbi:MAG: type II toxin-antitoxin system mRNA interferase toxin, RelE/StbE family [Patescibacteria group bacterium]|mgnify:CR=1 FL=1
MKLRFTPHFLRTLRKLSAEDQRIVQDTLRLFEKSPYDPALRNHPLRGTQKGLRSIAVHHDLRILYVPVGSHTVALLITVGTHEAVY